MEGGQEESSHTGKLLAGSVTDLNPVINQLTHRTIRYS